MILTEEEMALAMDTPAHPIEDLGVTRLGKCGHLFCVKELSVTSPPTAQYLLTPLLLFFSSSIRSWVLQGVRVCIYVTIARGCSRQQTILMLFAVR